MGGVDGLAMPRNLIDAVELDGRQAWLATVPAVVDELGDLCSLEIGQAYQPGGKSQRGARSGMRPDVAQV